MKQHIQLLILVVGFTACQTAYTERGKSGDFGQYNSSCGKRVLNPKKRPIESFVAKYEGVLIRSEVSSELLMLETEKFEDEPVIANRYCVNKIDLKLDQDVNLNDKFNSLSKKAKLPLKNYQGKNKAMKYGLKMLVYGLIIFPVSLFVVDALFWSGEDWTLLPFFVFLVLLIVSAVSIVLGLLLFFFGWIVSLFPKK